MEESDRMYFTQPHTKEEKEKKGEKVGGRGGGEVTLLLWVPDRVLRLA